MWNGIGFIGFMLAIVACTLWYQHEHFKNLTPAETTGAACYQRGGTKAVASCMAICEVKWPNDPGCKAQVVKEYE